MAVEIPQGLVYKIRPEAPRSAIVRVYVCIKDSVAGTGSAGKILEGIVGL